VSVGRYRSHTGITTILELSGDDPDRELDFDLQWLRSLSTQERFRLMFRRSREIGEMLIGSGHRKPFEIVRRP
jgi:hypothetical protein